MTEESTPEDPRLDYLRTVPDQVCLNLIEDAVSDTIGMHASSFAVAMMPLFRETDRIEMFDLCVTRLREKAVTKERILLFAHDEMKAIYGD